MTRTKKSSKKKTSGDGTPKSYGGGPKRAARLKRAREMDELFAENEQLAKKLKTKNGRRKPDQKAKDVFLTEEELLATYYPVATTPRPPPSDAFFARLHDELLAYAHSHVPTPAMTQSRWSIIHAVRDVARELWGPEVETVPFGSFVTGLYIGSSDIDLVILHVTTPKSQNAKMLAQLGARLRKLGLAKDVDIIPSARVPLLKYIDVDSNIPVDICLGIVDGVLSAGLMKKQVDAYPAFKPLTLFLKAFMQSMGLADVFKGGISSYILQVMILFHLQVQDALQLGNQQNDGTPATLTRSSKWGSSGSASASSSSSSSSPSVPPTSNLGYLIFTFFELFGFTFQYETHGIRIHDLKKPVPGANGESPMVPLESRLECYLKRKLGRYNESRKYLLSIEDPIQKERDIGSNCFGIRRIQRCFAQAREFLCTEPQEAQAQPSRAEIKKHQDASTPSSSLRPAYVIDTLGTAPEQSPVPMDTSPNAASPPQDPYATSFTSSFGFLLSSLLALPVKYSLADLKRAAVQQPAWNILVEKIERIERLQLQKAEKAERKAKAEAEKLAKAEKYMAFAAAAAARAAGGGSGNGAPSSSSIDLAFTSSSDDDDEGDEEEEGSSMQKPISIDDFEEQQKDREERRMSGDATATEGEGEEHEDQTTGEDQGETGDEDPDDVPTMKQSPAAAATSSSATSMDVDHVPLDGDALLAAGHTDDNMQLNLAK